MNAANQITTLLHQMPSITDADASAILAAFTQVLTKTHGNDEVVGHLDDAHNVLTDPLTFVEPDTSLSDEWFREAQAINRESALLKGIL